MSDNHLNFKNILVLNFGQLGDVIMSLPALSAIREKFPTAKITVMGGKSVAQIVKLSNFSDAQIVVDRVQLRDSPKLWSIRQILKLVGDVRRQKFDLVIDLHSLSETNLLGFGSGAKKRLYANRESRSLDILGNFQPKPPLEDKAKHLTDKYLDVLKPLGIENAKRFVKILPPPAEVAEIQTLFADLQISSEKLLVGMVLGAGHPSRRWSLDNFAELADKLLKNDELQVLVFLGPEELDLLDEVKAKFPPKAIILDKLKLIPLFTALSFLQVLVSNDTGPMHLGAFAGTSIVLILDERSPSVYLPLTKKLEIVKSGKIDEIKVDEVYQATQKILK